MGQGVGGPGAYLMLEHGDSAGVAEHDLILLALRNRPDRVSLFSGRTAPTAPQSEQLKQHAGSRALVVSPLVTRL